MDWRSTSALMYVCSSPHEPKYCSATIIHFQRAIFNKNELEITWGTVYTKKMATFFGRDTKFMLYPIFFFVCFPSKQIVLLKGRNWPCNLLREGNHLWWGGWAGGEEWQQCSLVVKSWDAGPEESRVGTLPAASWTDSLSLRCPIFKWRHQSSSPNTSDWRSVHGGREGWHFDRWVGLCD